MGDGGVDAESAVIVDFEFVRPITYGRRSLHARFSVTGSRSLRGEGHTPAVMRVWRHPTSWRVATELCHFFRCPETSLTSVELARAAVTDVTRASMLDVSARVTPIKGQGVTCVTDPVTAPTSAVPRRL